MDIAKQAGNIDQIRRRFFGTAASALAATQLGTIGSAMAQRVETKRLAIAPLTNSQWGR